MGAEPDTRCAAAVLDVDGVLTRTATLHERAWKSLFDHVLHERGEPAFSHDDYLHYVDGKPRLDGLRDFLVSRGISLAPEALQRLATLKNQHFLRLLERCGAEVFDDATRQVEAWRERGLRIAFVSASRNAQQVLRTTGLEHLCDVCIDGQVAAATNLAGKREMFLEAARRLATEPRHVLVVEDALSGVEAAAAGGFGMIIGLSRNDDGRHDDSDATAFFARGAHRVVRRLDELEDTA